MFTYIFILDLKDNSGGPGAPPARHFGSICLHLLAECLAGGLLHIGNEGKVVERGWERQPDLQFLLLK